MLSWSEKTTVDGDMGQRSTKLPLPCLSIFPQAEQVLIADQIASGPALVDQS